MQMQPSDVSTTVKALLDLAQLKLAEDEFQLLVKMYPPTRAGADSLYIAEARYEDPAVIFDPSWKGI